MWALVSGLLVTQEVLPGWTLKCIRATFNNSEKKGLLFYKGEKEAVGEKPSLSQFVQAGRIVASGKARVCQLACTGGHMRIL